MSDYCKIGSFAKVRRGASPRPIGDKKYFGGEVGWIRISDVTASNKYLYKTEQYVSELGESLSVRVDKGDLILSICGTIGRPIIIDFPSCIHDGFILLYEIKNADTEFLYYTLQFHEKNLENKGQPGTQINLNTKIVENFEIFFPSLPIQQKIAHILSTTDAVIEKTKHAIAKYKAIKKGMLHDLFTRGIDPATSKLRPRYEAAPHLYKESQLGRIPIEWEEAIFCTVVDIINGGTPSTENKEYWSGKIPWLSVDDFNNGKRYVFTAKKNITEDGLKSSATNILEKDMIIISARGTVGVISQLGKAMAFNQSCYGINSLSKRITNDFCYYFLIHYKEYFGFTSFGSVFTTITRDYFDGLKISFPCEQNEMTEVVKRISLLDTKLQTEQTYLQKLQQIKTGLMADLLSGKKTVKMDTETAT